MISQFVILSFSILLLALLLCIFAKNRDMSMFDVMGAVFSSVFIAYAVPLCVVIIFHFFKLVVFGNWKQFQFNAYVRFELMEQINAFYLGIWNTFSGLCTRLAR
jgi:hypothetical protein